jgi:KaiC/GvpD/RAD55 family RecA-like ATPase
MADAVEKYFPHTTAWIILNRLKEFNERPELIRELAVRFSKLQGHTIYFKFAPLFEEAVKYFDKHNFFPDLKYFNERFPDGRLMWEMTNASFSMDMYAELKKQLDYELILQGINERLGKCDTMDIEGCRYYGKVLTKFAETSVEIPVDVKSDWLNYYEEYEKTYHGIYTGNKMVDEQVGALTGITTIAAPSGNGKSTFALSVAYNVATLPDENGLGRNVLYISFEMTKAQLLANVTSIESSFSENNGARLKAEDIKEKKLDEKGKALVKQYMDSFMQRVNHSGGYLSLVDNTKMTGYNTIEEFIACIEEHSEKVGRKFDLIIIDNFDSLKMLKGERGQDESAKMNYFVTKLDSFSKTYMDGYGTCIVLLSQTNRDGLKKLRAMEANGSQEISIDFTVIQQYSALFERATAVLVLYSSALMRANNQLKLMPVKLRNKPLPRQPITLTTRWEYSYVGGGYVPPTVTTSDLTSLLKPNFDENADEIDEGMIGVEENTEEVPWDEESDDLSDLSLD